MEKITDILFSAVVTEGGEELGRVFEVRSAGEPEHGLVERSRSVTEILYGKRAFLEMLGLKQTSLESISTDAIKKTEPGKIVISDQDART
jgi:hypothetical protein